MAAVVYFVSRELPLSGLEKKELYGILQQLVGVGYNYGFIKKEAKGPLLAAIHLNGPYAVLLAFQAAYTDFAIFKFSFCCIFGFSYRTCKTRIPDKIRADTRKIMPNKVLCV